MRNATLAQVIDTIRRLGESATDANCNDPAHSVQMGLLPQWVW